MSAVNREDEASASASNVQAASVSVSASASNSDQAPVKSSGGKVKKFRLQIFSRFRSKEPEPKVQLYRRRTSSVGTEGEAMMTTSKKATLPKIPIESEPKSAPNLYF